VRSEHTGPKPRITGGFWASMQKGSRGVASAGLAAKILRGIARFPGEPGRFSEESSGSLEHTSRGFSCYAVIQLGYSRLQSTYSNPDRAMAGGSRSRRRSVGKHSGLYGHRASWEHGDWRPRRALWLHRPQPQQARCPPCRGSSVTEPCPASSGRGTRPPGNLTDSGRRLSVGFPAHLQEHFPDRRAVSWRQGNGREQTNRCSPGRRASRHSLDRYCRRWCRCAGHSRSRQ